MMCLLRGFGAPEEAVTRGRLIPFGRRTRSPGCCGSLMRAAQLPDAAPTGGATEPLDRGPGLGVGSHHILLTCLYT
jgi:hypothetical protein